MKTKGIPTYKAVILIVIGCLLCVGIVSIIYSFYKVLDYREYPISLNVAGKNQIGFNLNKEVISFGRVPQGATAKRNATVSQHYSFDVLVRIEVTGTASKMVYVEDNYFLLPPNETRQIEVTAIIPENQTPGNYTGKLRVYFERQ